MGPLSRREIMLGVLVVIALLLWIFGGDIMDATTAAIVVISLMLLLKVVTWDDITANKAAWNTLAWFATLVALAGRPDPRWIRQVVRRKRGRARGRRLADGGDRWRSY